jgi:hypothetical protein
VKPGSGARAHPCDQSSHPLQWSPTVSGFVYEFDWDPAKAQANFSKHGVSFERAAERPRSGTMRRNDEA